MLCFYRTVYQIFFVLCEHDSRLVLFANLCKSMFLALLALCSECDQLNFFVLYFQFLSYDDEQHSQVANTGQRPMNVIDHIL